MFVRIGYFADFNDSNVILLDGDAEALGTLADLLRELEFVNAAPIKLHDLPFASPYGGIKLTVLPVSYESGIRRDDAIRPHFSWRHSKEGWLEASEIIEQVANSGRSCHNWLEAIGTEDAHAMVSIGEYDFSWWQQHFET